MSGVSREEGMATTIENCPACGSTAQSIRFDIKLHSSVMGDHWMNCFHPWHGRDRIEGKLRNRILFIGGKTDVAPTISHPDGIQIYMGCPNDLIAELAEAAREDSGTPARCPTCNSPNIILRGVLGVINLYRIDVARRGAALCADKWHDTRAEDSGTAPTPLLDQLLDDCVQTIVTDALSGNDRRWLMNRTRDRISALISIYLERRGAVGAVPEKATLRIKCVGCGRYGNLEYVADIIEAVPVVESAATADQKCRRCEAGQPRKLYRNGGSSPDYWHYDDIGITQACARRASVPGEKESESQK